MKRGSSAGGLMVGHLAWNAKGAGLTPAQLYTFCLREKFTLRENYLFIIISELRTFI